MSRPENVKCENCCYWTRAPETKASGVCVRFPRRESLSTGDLDWCGEFRAEWPGPAPRHHIFAGIVEGARGEWQYWYDGERVEKDEYFERTK